jgi:glycosyl transferase, family 25
MPHPLDLFDKIFVINLATRDDRRREMDEQLRHIGLALDSPLVEVFEAVRPEDRGDFPSIGARGCFMSHLGVLKLAASRKLDAVLILEDDLNFSDDFMQRIPVVADRLRGRDWSIFYGGYRLDGAMPEARGGCADVSADTGVQTAHFFAVRGAAIAALVDYLAAQLQRPPGDVRGGPMHVDGSYTWFRREYSKFATVVAVPELGYQRASRTDIHDLGLRDSLPILRTAVAAFRRLKNRL